MNSLDFLKSCQLQSGNVCKVVGGYAKNFFQLFIDFPLSYHQIPLNTDVVVLYESEDDGIMVEGTLVMSDLEEKVKIRQVLKREDLILIGNSSLN
jgi:hypothetical protein